MALPTIVNPPTVVPPHRPHQGNEPAWEVALLFPPQGEWSEDEYLALDTNRLVELSDGRLEVLPMPALWHQFIVRYLFQLLDGFVVAHASGRVLFAPLPIHLWSLKFREPDIIYLRPERIRDVRRPPQGADLVMEVVSEGAEDRKRDLETKREEYARARISEYWIVDPQEQRIIVLTLDGETYREHGIFGPGTQATSVLLPGFSVAVDAVLAAGQGGQ